MWITPTIMPAVLLGTGTALAQTAPSDSPASFALEPPPAEQLNHFGLGYRMGLNFGLSFKGLGGFTPAGHFVPGNGFQSINPGPAGGHGFNRTYEDGYNWRDNNNNDHFGQLLTWFWGYDSADQVQNASIVMHASSSPASAESQADADGPHPGFELFYQRELHRGEHWRGGLEVAFGYTALDVKDSRPLAANVNRLSDAFALPLNDGVPITPLPPQLQRGTFEGPGALLSDDPQRSISLVADGASIVGGRNFSANLYGFRFGPYLELPLGKRVALSLSGGLALAYVESDFTFNETVAIAGVGAQSHSGAGSDSSWLPGGYVAGSASVALSDRWAAFAGAQFQALGQYTQEVSGKQAVLDLRKSIYVTLGLSYSF